MIFRSYETGQEFIDENLEILQNNPIETRFFKFNAMNMSDMSNGFIVKVINDDKFVLALRYDIYSMVIFGDDSLLEYLATELFKRKYKFEKILGSDKAVNLFIHYYEKLAGGSHKIVHSMEVMICKQIKSSNIDTSIVENANADDIQEVAEILYLFQIEINDKVDLQRIIEKVKKEIENYVLIRQDNKIVSIAKSCQEDEKVCAISSVFTIKEFRGKGMAKKVMIFLTNKILNKGKYSYLYVDKANPISNHLYSSIGYSYLAPQTDIAYIPPKQL